MCSGVTGVIVFTKKAPKQMCSAPWVLVPPQDFREKKKKQNKSSKTKQLMPGIQIQFPTEQEAVFFTHITSYAVHGPANILNLASLGRGHELSAERVCVLSDGTDQQMQKPEGVETGDPEAFPPTRENCLVCLHL